MRFSLGETNQKQNLADEVFADILAASNGTGSWAQGQGLKNENQLKTCTKSTRSRSDGICDFTGDPLLKSEHTVAQWNRR
jgi:hypothetical protein